MLKSESTNGLHQCLLYRWLCQCDIGTQLNCAGEQIAQVQPVMLKSHQKSGQFWSRCSWKKHRWQKNWSLFPGSQHRKPEKTEMKEVTCSSPSPGDWSPLASLINRNKLLLSTLVMISFATAMTNTGPQRPHSATSRDPADVFPHEAPLERPRQHNDIRYELNCQGWSEWLACSELNICLPFSRLAFCFISYIHQMFTSSIHIIYNGKIWIYIYIDINIH